MKEAREQEIGIENKKHINDKCSPLQERERENERVRECTMSTSRQNRYNFRQLKL
jgi:hypothetical protein